MSDHKTFTLPPGEGAKVCVGGGAGFIGSHIAKRLKESGYHVTVVGAFIACLLLPFHVRPCGAVIRSEVLGESDTSGVHLLLLTERGLFGHGGYVIFALDALVVTIIVSEDKMFLH
jgi:hypothetical protein